MKKRWLKLLLPLLMAIILVLAIATPVLAIADPDDITIHNVWAYQHCLEEDDQLYLIDYEINYTALPDEIVTEAFLCRLLDGEEELRAVAPFSYYSGGYSRGAIAIYFSADDVPTWEGDYTIELTGNPLLDWVGEAHTASVTGFIWSLSDSMAVTKEEVAGRILSIASTLENYWTNYALVEPTGGGIKLTEYGEYYFLMVQNSMKEIAPMAFSGMEFVPNYEYVEQDTTYEEELETSVSGTPLDLTELAEVVGVSNAFLTGTLYMIVAVVFLAIVSKYSKSYKPAILLLVPVIIGGALLGVLSLTVAIMMGFVDLVLIGYVLFYQKSSA